MLRKILRKIFLILNIFIISVGTILIIAGLFLYFFANSTSGVMTIAVVFLGIAVIQTGLIARENYGKINFRPLKFNQIIRLFITCVLMGLLLYFFSDLTLGVITIIIVSYSITRLQIGSEKMNFKSLNFNQFVQSIIASVLVGIAGIIIFIELYSSFPSCFDSKKAEIVYYMESLIALLCVFLFGVLGPIKIVYEYKNKKTLKFRNLIKNIFR